MRTSFRSTDCIDEGILLKSISIRPCNQYLPTFVDLCKRVPVSIMEVAAIVHEVLDIKLSTVQIDTATISAGPSNIIHPPHHQSNSVGLEFLHAELCQVRPKLDTGVGTG
eukprot:Skav209484  [mRNA]  locus=scaffold1892:118804:120695:- [translate_table: standard]